MTDWRVERIDEGEWGISWGVTEWPGENGDAFKDIALHINDEETAHLISAAPDMKAALEAVVKWGPYNSEMERKAHDMARVALAKAIGMGGGLRWN